MLRFLSRSDIGRAITMREAIEVMKTAFRRISSGEADVPLRQAISTQMGVTLLMPAYLRAPDALGVKIASVYPGNAAASLPTVNALVTVLNVRTGEPTAILEGACLTSLRTGAASGLATDLLARRNARVLAIFGAGAQARTQVEAVCCMREIREIRILSRTGRSAAAFASELRDAKVAATPAEAIAGADIVVTATNSSTPVFPGSGVEAGTHLNAIGSFRPDMQELDETTVRRAKIVVDQRAAVLSEAGDLIVPMQKGLISARHIYAELGELVDGLKPARQSDEEVTLFKSVGNAAQDVALALAILEKAQAQGLGVPLALD